MSSSPEPRVLRGPLRSTVTTPVIDPVEGLLYTLDGRPVSAEVKAAKDAGFAKGWDKGWSEGFERGHGEGQRQAYEEFRSLLLPALDTVDAAVRQLAEADQLVLDELSHLVVDLVYQLVEALLGRELALAEAPVIDALRRALAFVPDRGRIVARVNPHDADLIGAVDELAPSREIELLADPTVERGGCVLEVGACRVDAQLGPALERARAVLSQSRPSRTRGDG